MQDAYRSWSRLLAAGTSMTRTGMQLVETIGAANTVLAVRLPLIQTALCSPLTGDHAEMARMVPEKVEAFSRAGSVMVAAWWQAQSAWIGHMQHLGGVAARGHVPTGAEMADIGARSAALTLDMVEATARAGAASLAPIHRKAAANARRLKRAKT